MGSVSPYLASHSPHLNNATSITPPSLFPSSLPGKFYKSHFSPKFCFCGPLSFVPCTSMLWSSIHVGYCSTASTAQHSTAQSARTMPQSKYVPIRVRQRKHAAKVGESQHAVEHLYNTLQTKKSKSARPTKIYNYSQRWCDARRIRLSFDLNKIHTLLFFAALLFLLVRISYMHEASGLLSWSIEHLALATCQFAPKIVDLSVRFIRILLCSSL